jgi:hypothetical protein
VKTIWQLLVVGFEDSSFVWFFPNVIGFHVSLPSRRRGTARLCQ